VVGLEADHTLHRPPALPTVLSRTLARVRHHTHVPLDVASHRGQNQTRDRAHAHLYRVIQGTDTEGIETFLGLSHEVGVRVEVQAAGDIERGAIRAVRADMAEVRKVPRLW
jgi:hypothetical protein